MGSLNAVTDNSFEQAVVQSKTPVLVDFWAEWCPPCKAIAPVLEEIAEELNGKVTILKLNVDDNRATAEKFNIRSIPTLMLFKDGKMVDQMMGKNSKERMIEFISKLI